MWLGCVAGLSWAWRGMAMSWARLGLSWCTDTAPVGGCSPQLLCCLLRAGAMQASALLFQSIVAGDCLQPQQRQCALQVSALCLCGGPVGWLGAEAGTAAPCVSLDPPKVVGESGPSVGALLP